MPAEGDETREARRGPMIAEGAVNVEYNHHGAWKIGLPDGEPLVCETLQEALRMAYLFAVKRSPCELTVHDAYHRLILHRVIDADDRSGASLSSPVPSPAKAASAVFAGSGRQRTSRLTAAAHRR